LLHMFNGSQASGIRQVRVYPTIEAASHGLSFYRA
jgi:hypothetical protein